MQQLRQTLRLIESAATALRAWQSLMRASGSGAVIQTTTSAIFVASRMLRPADATFLILPGPSPEQLDLRTRLRFLFDGLTILGCLSWFGRLFIQRAATAKRNQQWGRDLARKGLWTRLTATRPHSAIYTLASTVIAALAGVAAYRHRADVGGPALYPEETVNVLGQVFPRLPVLGLARGSAGAPGWLRLILVPAVVYGPLFAIAALRSALMSDREYRESRRRWRDETGMGSSQDRSGE